jgi:hypothetical protein
LPPALHQCAAHLGLRPLPREQRQLQGQHLAQRTAGRLSGRGSGQTGVGSGRPAGMWLPDCRAGVRSVGLLTLSRGKCLWSGRVRSSCRFEGFLQAEGAVRRGTHQVVPGRRRKPGHERRSRFRVGGRRSRAPPTTGAQTRSPERYPARRVRIRRPVARVGSGRS